jgi:AcrR family transcriptional regulator
MTVHGSLLRIPTDMKAKKTAPKRGRPLKQDATQDKQERILDAAEEYFSEHGFDGVSIRDVATAAGVDTALLHYYFDTKKGLFDAVFRRRAEILNRMRIESINAYVAAMGDKVTVEGAVEAFTGPLFDLAAQGDPRWKHYFALLAQVNNTPHWGGKTMARYFDPVIQRLIEVVRIPLPDASPEDLYWSYHFLSGALTLTLSQTGRIDRLSNGLCRSEDFRAVHERMAPFIAAGFMAVCNKKQSSKAAAPASKRARREEAVERG